MVEGEDCSAAAQLVQFAEIPPCLYPAHHSVAHCPHQHHFAKDGLCSVKNAWLNEAEGHSILSQELLCWQASLSIASVSVHNLLQSPFLAIASNLASTCPQACCPGLQPTLCGPHHRTMGFLPPCPKRAGTQMALLVADPSRMWETPWIDPQILPCHHQLAPPSLEYQARFAPVARGLLMQGR